MTLPQVPEYVRTLNPYVPGKPIEETKRELGLKKVVKLASNENPLGPSPLALEALESHLKGLHRYPDGSAHSLKLSLAKREGVVPSQLIVGNGSNEVIELLIRTYCVAGDAILTHRGAFIAYGLCAQAHGVRALEASVDSELCWTTDELLKFVREDARVKIVFLANPNNPTGAYFNAHKHSQLVDGLKAIRGGSTLLVLDYAYWEYVRATDLVSPSEALNSYDNCVVLRTFSKVYGLAGLRVGYGVGKTELIGNVEKIREPFNVNSLGLVGAEAAIKDAEFVQKSIKNNVKGFETWEKALSDLKVQFWPSQGNFILMNTATGFGLTASELFQSCLKLGVILRPIGNYGFPNGVRITIGTPSENRLAIDVLTRVKGKR